MKRSGWEFGYSGGVLAAAARNRAAYHREREQWWQTEQDKAEATLRANGLTVREAQVTGGTRADVVLDPHLQARYQECWNKRLEHRRTAEEYDGWDFVLSQNADARLTLNHDDVLYFRIEAPSVPEGR